MSPTQLLVEDCPEGTKNELAMTAGNLFIVTRAGTPGKREADHNDPWAPQSGVTHTPL